MTKKINLMLVGDENVGKTDIWHKLADSQYKMVKQRKTIGVDHLRRKNVNNINWEIWDSSGQEIISSVVSKYYSNNNIILVCYDLNNTKSFTNLSKYLKTAKEKEPKAQIILVGNKSDLEQVVVDEDISNFMEENNITHHVKVSVKNNNIKDLEDKITELLPKEMKKDVTEQPQEGKYKSKLVDNKTRFNLVNDFVVSTGIFIASLTASIFLGVYGNIGSVIPLYAAISVSAISFVGALGFGGAEAALKIKDVVVNSKADKGVSNLHALFSFVERVELEREDKNNISMGK